MTYDPTDLEKNSREEESRLLDIKRVKKEEQDDLRWLMNTKRGRRLAFRILNTNGAWARTFNTNAMQMAFNEGRRHSATVFEDELIACCFESYLEMIRENKSGKELDGNAIATE